MILKKYLLSGYGFIVALCASFLFASCGSYQYVGYENDGIYSDDVVVYQETPNSVTTDANSSSYYKSYFDEKASELDSQEDIIFTDVDSYQSDALNDNYVAETNTAYAGWGQDNSEVQINVYNNRPFLGFGYYPFYSGYYGYYGGIYGRGYLGFGYNFYDPFYYGYGMAYSPFYYGYPYSFPFYGNRFYGNRFYGNGYYGNGYYGNRYYGNNLSYNTGRRSAAAIVNDSYNNRRRNVISRDNSRTRSSSQIIQRPRSNTREIISRDGRRSQIISRPRGSEGQRTISPQTNSRTRVNAVPRRSNDVRRSTPTRSSNEVRRSSTPNRNNNIQRSTPIRSNNNSIQRSSPMRSSSGATRGNSLPIRSSSSRRGNN